MSKQRKSEIQVVQRTKLPTKETILFISHDASRTGAPILLLNILRWLRARIPNRFKILLRQGGPLEPLFREIGDVVNAADSGIGDSFLDDVGIIYSNTITNGIFLETLPYGNIPILTHVHEMDYVTGLHGSDNIHEVKKHTDHFISCSKATAASLTQNQGIDAAKITVIPGSVSPSDILGKSKAKNPLQIRKSLGIDAKALVILGCGTRDLRKGFDLYIQLAAYCASKQQSGRKLEFLWIGYETSDPVSEMLQRDARKLGRSIRLRFLGELENPYPYIAAADLFCLPSREDPLPLVMLEAGALGKPTLAFKGSGGAEEFCRQCGGFLAPYIDVAGMGDWILNRLMDTTIISGTGRKAEKLIHKKYTMDVNGPQYVRLIKSCLRKNVSAGMGMVQLFIPGATGYTEETSICRQVSKKGWHRFRFDFQAQGLSNSRVVRFDPLDRISIIDITKIVLTSSGNRTLWKADAPEDFKQIHVAGSALRIPDAKVLKLLSLGSDPILYLPELGINEGEQEFRLDVVLRVDKSPEALAPYWLHFLHFYNEHYRQCRNAGQIRTPLSGDPYNIEKLGLAILFSGISINERTTYIWGTGAAARHLSEVMVRQGYEFHGFIDPDMKKEGRTISEHAIFSPVILSRQTGMKPFIIIGSQFHSQISRRLKKMGFIKGADFAPSPFL
jgi:glycosyltransferase involved in cell wall biosynthesis